MYALDERAPCKVSRDDEIIGMDATRVNTVNSGAAEDEGIGTVEVSVAVVVDMMGRGKKKMRTISSRLDLFK